MDENRFASPQSPSGVGETTLAVSPEVMRAAVTAMPPADTETAHRLFEEEVRRLPGVLRVDRWGEEGSSAPTYHIYLRSDDRHSEDAVYEVKGQIYDRFPEAYLDVVVLEAVDGVPPDGEPAA